MSINISKKSVLYQFAEISAVTNNEFVKDNSCAFARQVISGVSFCILAIIAISYLASGFIGWFFLALEGTDTLVYKNIFVGASMLVHIFALIAVLFYFAFKLLELSKNYTSRQIYKKQPSPIFSLIKSIKEKTCVKINFK